MRKVSGLLKTVVVASAFAGSMIIAPAPAQAATPAEAIQHFIECANWLVSDPAKHAQYCSPGLDVFVSGSTGFAAEEIRCSSLVSPQVECLDVSNCCQ